MLFLQIITVALLLIGLCVVTSTRTRIKDMSDSLDRLTAEVAETKTVAASAKAMIAGLAQQIRDNATDEAALNQLADDLDSSTNDLAGALTENTPAEPTA